MKECNVYVSLVFETDSDEFVNNFTASICDFIKQYDGRQEEFLSSRVTVLKGRVYDDPFKNVK